MWRLAQPRIIRCPITSPTNANGSFYYNLLHQTTSFRAESDIVCRDGNWFKQCIRKGVFTTSAELDVFLRQYASYNLWDTIKLNKVHTDLESIQPLAANHAGEDVGDDAPQALLAGAAAMQAVLHGELAAEQGPYPAIVPIQHLRDLMEWGGPEAEPAPTGKEAAGAEAAALCTPQLLYPLAVAFADLHGAQRDAVQAVIAGVEEAQGQLAAGPGTPSAKPLIITIHGGPGELRGPL